MDFGEQVGDVGVELLDHAAHGLLEFGPLLFDALLLDAHLGGKRVQQLGCLVQGLVVLLCEGVVDAVKELEPRFDGLELCLVSLVQLFLNPRYVLLQLHQLL